VALSLKVNPRCLCAFICSISVFRWQFIVAGSFRLLIILCSFGGVVGYCPFCCPRVKVVNVLLNFRRKRWKVIGGDCVGSGVGKQPYPAIRFSCNVVYILKIIEGQCWTLGELLL
jgi:hypothetical protein